MKITVLLRNDHEILRGLFNKFKRPSVRNNGKKELFNEIYREILVHSEMESEILYPALAATPSPRATELVSMAEQDHRAIEQLLEELDGINGADKNFESKMSLLMDRVEQHIEMEEGDIFVEARKNLPEFRLEELGLEMEDRRKIFATLAA